ncbi:MULTISPECIES: hypothetical protein [unclassified Pseudomonas]|uniref:hypothetical protein n=1 Tax=unclassified Pseudomonas TaxID=196821 RepID=UPI000A1EAD00|nr:MULTISPECIES: hypothetical protein [unclassified Pseudomonas]
MTDEMRAEFEVAFRAQFGFGATDVRDSKSEDGAALMGAALWAWEASREAVVVDLPKDIVTMAGPVLYADDARAAIEAQGLKVAP